MKKEDLEAQVVEVFQRVVPEADLKSLDPAKSFRDQIEIDSVDYLSFILELEKSLSIKIPEADYPKLSSLNGCLSYLDVGTSPQR
jgi:acyl carrier protein